MHFVLESDRDVLVDGIGLLPAGQPVDVTAEAQHMFKTIHNVPKLGGANFPPFVSVTAVIDTESEGGN